MHPPFTLPTVVDILQCVATLCTQMHSSATLTALAGKSPLLPCEPSRATSTFVSRM